MDACKPQMASLMGRDLAFMVLSTLDLATLVSTYGSTTCLSGAKFGFFVGPRLLNGCWWEMRSDEAPADCRRA